MKISTHQSDKQPLSLVRILVLTLISLVASVLLYQAWDSDFSYAYRQHLMATDVIELDFNNLQPITIEQSKKDYRLNWWCIPDNSNPDFGDLACNAYLKRWNSIPAMFTAFWFKDGQLHNAKIDVPYWNHATLIRQIKKEYGEPIKRSSRLNYLGIAKKLGN